MIKLRGWLHRNCKFALQELDVPSWRSGKTFLGDVSEDLFVHFTTKENAEKILATSTLGEDGFSTFAVSTTYGIFYPGVQTTHIKGENLVAVVFSTDAKPTHGYIEEVVWNGATPIRNIEIISVDDASSLLSQAPVKIEDDDVVIYDLNNL
jgi:hypothetical protein